MLRLFVKPTLAVLCALLVALVAGDTQVRAAVCAYVVEMVTFDAAANDAFGIDYHEPTDALLVSVNTPTGVPNNLDLVNALAVHAPIPTLAGLPGPISVTTVRSSSCLGGFTPGDMFVGNGMPGGITRLTNNGLTVQNPWVVLPGEAGYVTGLYQDRHCSFGGDLIVVTGDEANPNVGSIWRVTSAGAPTLIVTLNTHLEGVITVPNDPLLWGPMAGRILAGDEDRVGTSTNGPDGKIFAVDPTGDFITIGNADADIEVMTLLPTPGLFPINPGDLDIIPTPRQGIPGDGDFFGVANGGSEIRRVPGIDASGTQGFGGCGCEKILMTQEFPEEGTTGLVVLRWDGSFITAEPVYDFASTPVSSWQQATFKGGVYCGECSGVIGDFVWEDLDADGIQDTTEPGIAGVEVTLTGPDGYSASVFTDATGHYQFSQLCAGDYAVTVTEPSGFTASPTGAGDEAGDSNPNPSNVTLTSDTASDLTIDFGFYRPAGRIIVQKVTVPPTDTTTQFTFTTTGAGYVGFTLTGGTSNEQVLAPGTYSVTEVVPAGWTLTSATCDSVGSPSPSSISLDSGETVTCTFTNTRQPAALGDFVWNDLNANGIQDSGEPGIAGATVELYDATATTLISTTTTGASGLYLFSNLAPGTYVVRFVQPAGYAAFSPANQGSNDAADSDANVTTGFTGPYTLAAGETNLTVDAGFYKLASLGDFVWKDVNNNGIQDSGEAGVSGVTVQLYNGTGTTLLGTTTTNASGLYGFSSLTPGSYTVKFTLPGGYTFSPANQGTNDALDSDANATTGFTGAYTLTSGQSNLTVDAGLFQPPVTPPCTPTTIQFAGNSSTSGTNGNIRTFTVGGVSVKASAFGRTAAGAWSTAYLGVYSSGLGVTDRSEGTGGGNTHKVDNLDWRDNYVLFEFNGPVTIDKAFLDYIGADSDLTIWVGTKTNPYNNHQTLSDAFLASLGGAEPNDASTSSSSRWADVNAGHESGNVIVIAASVSDETPDDEFKISKLLLDCPPPVTPPCEPATLQFAGNSATSGTAGNVRTFSTGGVSVRASAFSRTSAGTWNTAFLGLYSTGLGVTDGSEGSGGSNTHKLDNVGRDNYILLEFNGPVTVNKAFLDSIGGDSDLTVWVGTKADPYNNHQTLSDAFLASLGGSEQNDTSSTSSSRWADVNAASEAGNVVVIAASTSDETPDDEFKLSKLMLDCPGSTPPPPPQCVDRTFAFSGNSASSGSAGNVRTFTVNGVSVRVSAFSRTDSGGSWSTAYLGLFGPGLGVTDGSEGDGGKNKHKVDNIGGRDNYVLFEFSAPVVIDRAFLDAIGNDSDITVWIGSRSDPYHNHQTLSDSFLNSLAKEDNTTTSTADSRWANVNGGKLSGNVLVIAAQASDSSPEDEFKISKLVTECR